jgi:hypothetical protein
MDTEKKMKKIYEKPSYEVEEIFEKMSLACYEYVFICKASADFPHSCIFPANIHS